MATTRHITPKFTEKELLSLLELIEVSSQSIDILEEQDNQEQIGIIESAVKSFDNAIERIGYYRENGILIKG